MEQPHNIKFCFKLGKTATETHEMLVQVYGQDAAETDKRGNVVKPKPQVETHLDKPLIENLNILSIDGEEARSVTEAIQILSTKEAEVDLHPERRMKAAFNAFEVANMSRIKEENPTLRLSQLKQILKKEWMKSPDNPLNQRSK